MKKIIYLVLALLSGTTCFAQDSSGRTIFNRKIILEAPPRSVTVNDGVSVVFISNLSKEIYIEGKREAISAVSVTINNDVLVITSNRPELAAPATVYLSPESLQSITINGESRVGNYGMLDNQKIDVLINSANCELVIRTRGILNISAGDEYSFIKKVKKATE
jgi:hypothetical protein